ncbi:outer membrane beta-barrel protein [Paraflavitalea speifideaquila]|uniref:outer membrane beta-barrel protein n=1 Tax=Paraflavitalea speifideaquila TaxID=3076558 RepID=UPI0028EC44B8|nr:outer membrane beta-barrel protein [Paraflavitalea speifideiaquila]
MKRQILLLLVITISFTTTLTAQVQKGDWLLGATMGVYYGSSSNLNGSSTNSNLSPRISYAIGNNSVLGLKVGFGYQTSKSETNSDKSNNTSIGTTIYWRHYMTIKKQLGWYLEPSAGFSTGRNVQTYPSGKVKNTYTGYTVNVTPGLYYQALPKLLVNVDFGGLGYVHNRNKSGELPSANHPM